MARHRVELDGTVKVDYVSSYYGQRSTPGGLVLTEATAIMEEGVVSLRAPGIYTQKHVEAWKAVVQKVKKTGAVFFMQVRSALMKIQEPLVDVVAFLFLVYKTSVFECSSGMVEDARTLIFNPIINFQWHRLQCPFPVP